MKRLVWLNGNFVTEDKAALSIYDSALMFGDMVFEMTRSFNHVHFKLDEHLNRLYDGLKILNINPGMSRAELARVCYDVTERNLISSIDEHRLMIGVSRGQLPIYHDVSGFRNKSTVFVSDFPLSWTVAGMGEYYWDGVDVVIPQQRQIPSSLLDPKVKNRSRVHYMRATQEAAQFSGERNWAVLLDSSGYVTEGPGYNIFFVKNGELFTPRVHNVLPGISRQFICDHLPVHEVDIDLSMAMLADEAFLTATPFCVMPVRSFHGVEYGSVERSKIILDWWSEEVGLDIVMQMKSFKALKQGGLSIYGSRQNG